MKDDFLSVLKNAKSMQEVQRHVQNNLRDSYIAIMEELDQLFTMAVANKGKLSRERAERFSYLLDRKKFHDVENAHVVKGIDKNYLISTML